MKYTRVWAHRGASAYAPENTMPAFELAEKMKSDGIEIDVHRTADGFIVVNHDHTIDRTSSGNGEISKLTLAEIREFDILNAAVFGDKFKGTKMSTLAEVYDFIKNTDMTINVEIKSSGSEYVKQVYDVAAYVGIDNEKIIFSSFAHQNLTDLLAIDSRVYTAPLYDKLENPFEYSKKLNSYALHPSYGQTLEGDYIKNAHNAGFMINPWTVDDPNAQTRLLELGADAIITNRPDVALECRRKFQAKMSTSK